MKKKLMSISDLYNFCMNNNFAHFSYNESNYELCVQMPAMGLFKKEETDKHKEGLKPFTAKAYHDNVNLNKSEIDPDVFKENTKSAPFRPILAHIVTNPETGEKDFNSHDFTIEEDDEGNIITVYQEQPVGVINGDFSFEYDEEQKVTRAILNGYLYESYCQDAIDILERRGGTDCSIELNIREMSFNNSNKSLLLDDYYISGLTLLGASVAPGMKGSNLTLADFSTENNSVFSHAEINTKLIDTLEKINTTLEGFNIKNTDGKEENTLDTNIFEEEIVEEVTEEVAEESTVEETVVQNEEETVESTPEETVEMSEEVAEEVEEESNEESEEVQEFSKYFEIKFEISHDEIRYALYNLVSQFDELDNDYYYIRNVYDNYFVMQSWCNNAIYGCEYSVDGENVSLVGERYRLFEELLTESEKTKLDEMRSNYSAIQEKLNKYEKAELDAQKDAIFADKSYKEYLETDEFKSLINDKDKYSVDELKDKADIAFAKCVKKAGSFASMNVEVEPKPTRHVFTKAGKENKKKTPYGNIFNKD